MPTIERRRPSNRRIALIALAAVLFVLLVSLRGIAGFYTDYLWFEELGYTDVWRGLLVAKALPTAVFTVVFFLLILGNLDHRRPAPAPLPPRRPGGGARRAVPPVHRPLRRPGPGGSGRLPGHRRGQRAHLAVERLAPLPPPGAVRRSGRPPVRRRHRLLRLHAALPPVHLRVDVRRPRDRPPRDGGGPLPQRRHPGPGPVPAGHPPGEGPPLGAPRSHGPAEGVRVLAPALRAQLLQPGGGARRQLHRREGGAPGAQHADRHLGRRRPPVLRQPVAEGLGAPDHRRRPVVVRVGDHRRDLSRRSSRRSASSPTSSRRRASTSSATSAPPGPRSGSTKW